MKNWYLYRKIITNPEGLEALQNSHILPKEYVRYSDALSELEKQEFFTFLHEDSFKGFRNKIDQERIFQNKAYLKRCELDKPLKTAEEQRQKARNILNDALYLGYIKSVIYKFDKDKVFNTEPDDLPKSFWQSKRALNIDVLSMYFTKNNDLYVSEGLVALDRKSLEKWGDAYPEIPNMVGRKKGSGKINDDPALTYMHNLILEKKMSPHRAAELAIEECGINGNSREADIDRLGRKYRKQHP